MRRTPPPPRALQPCTARYADHASRCRAEFALVLVVLLASCWCTADADAPESGLLRAEQTLSDAASPAEALRRWRLRVRESQAEGATANTASASAGGGRDIEALPAACDSDHEAVLFWQHPRFGSPEDAPDDNDPGYFSEWGPSVYAPEVELLSEEVVLSAAFCLPHASPFALDDCEVELQYQGLDMHVDQYRTCCTSGCAKVVDIQLASGGWVRQCGEMRKPNHEPGQFLLTGRLSCHTGAGTRGGRGELRAQRLIHLDGLVHWQAHTWVLESWASGAGLREAIAGSPAAFVVHVADRSVRLVWHWHMCVIKI